MSETDNNTGPVSTDWRDILEPTDSVIVYVDAQKSEQMIGIVINKHPNTCDVMIASPTHGIAIIKNAWYIHDPRIKERPGALPNVSGFFDVSPQTRRTKTFIARLEAIERKQMDFVIRMEDLAGKVQGAVMRAGQMKRKELPE